MNKLYKIQHIPSGKFLRIKLLPEGIKVWKEQGVLEGKGYGYGKVLYDTAPGWKTPPVPTDEEFAEIDCRVVIYNVIEQEI